MFVVEVEPGDTVAFTGPSAPEGLKLVSSEDGTCCVFTVSLMIAGRMCKGPTASVGLQLVSNKDDVLHVLVILDVLFAFVWFVNDPCIGRS